MAGARTWTQNHENSYFVGYEAHHVTDGRLGLLLPNAGQQRSGRSAYVGGFVGPHYYSAAKAGLHGLVHFLSSRADRRRQVSRPTP